MALLLRSITSSGVDVENGPGARLHPALEVLGEGVVAAVFELGSVFLAPVFGGLDVDGRHMPFAADIDETDALSLELLQGLCGELGAFVGELDAHIELRGIDFEFAARLLRSSSVRVFIKRIVSTGITREPFILRLLVFMAASNIGCFRE